MRRLVRTLGAAFILLSLSGLALLALGPREDAAMTPPDGTANAELARSRPDSQGAVAALDETAEPAPGPTSEAAPGVAKPQVVLDEHFTDNRMSWPDNRASTAWFGGGDYRLAAREARRFAAVGAPINTPIRDAVLTATFQKVGGPSGGGFGLIIRDQEPSSRDGVQQDGHFYVLEVGDKGEIGIWRRAGDDWVDLLPWTPSEAVHVGGAPNDLEVRATGARLTMLVNGVQVASRVDDVLAAGGVGVFVGGDSNEVAVQHFSVRTLPDEQGRSGSNWAAPGPILAAPTATIAAFLPITRVVIPSISLSSDAVPAQLVQKDGSLTWDVPAFKIGHAEGTAGAGGPGNTVLVGHVTSRSMGNVFENLHRAHVGDGVQVFSSEREFDYRVVDIRTVGRTDVSVVGPTNTPSLTLITCTGVWLPLVSDYAERLVLRAELAAETRP